MKRLYAPQIIAHELMQKHGIHFSYTSIYSLIKNHRHEWRKHIILMGKRRRKRSKDAYRGRSQDRQELSLLQLEANERTRIGDIEVDTCHIIERRKSCLFVAVDRCTRYYMIEKTASQSAEEIMQKAILKISKNFRIKTITYDNGSKKPYTQKSTNSLAARVFSSNHTAAKIKNIGNRNKILQQFLKKGTNFDLILEDGIRYIQDIINNKSMKPHAELISSFVLIL